MMVSGLASSSASFFSTKEHCLQGHIFLSQAAVAFVPMTMYKQSSSPSPHSLFILSIPESHPSEQSLVHFPSENLPLSEARDFRGWLFSFPGKEKKTSMNLKNLVSLIVLYYPESKSLITIYTKVFSTAQAENCTVSCSRIPALLCHQELEVALEVIKMRLVVFTSMCMEDGREVHSQGSGPDSRELALHCPDTQISSETVQHGNPVGLNDFTEKMRSLHTKD